VPEPETLPRHNDSRIHHNSHRGGDGGSGRQGIIYKAMSKPKNMTPDELEKWKADKSLYIRKWREANRDKIRAWRQDYYAKNAEKCRQIVRDWRKVNRERTNELGRKWRARNPEKARKRHIERREFLAVDYIANLMGLHSKTLLKYPELIEAKREQVKAIRELKQQKQKQ
jgi:hypothetical protein